MESTQTRLRGCSPIGVSACSQRQPRKACASMPKGRERTIQVQFISLVSTSRMLPKSKSRYIQ